MTTHIAEDGGQQFNVTCLSDAEIAAVMSATFPGVWFKFEPAMIYDPLDIYLVNIVATDGASEELKNACSAWQELHQSRLFGSSGEAICTFLDCVNEQKEGPQ